jgi:quinone-modifying oxidoreductase subunit QmoC
MSDETKREETTDQAQTLRVDPDLEFVETISEWGGGDLKACFQCATCSVVCPLSPDVNPFPRKEVIWAQWGLKERLVTDPDLWLCHRCNDCSENCPRGAKTGDVMAALRSYAYQTNAWPAFLGRWANRPTMLPVLLAFPLLAVWALIAYGGQMAAPLGENASLSSRYWGNMIEPWPYLDLGFMAVAAFAVLSLAQSIRRVWQGFMRSGVQPDVTPRTSILNALYLAVLDIVFHRRFAECGAAHARRGAHLLILFGFAGLFVTTVLVFTGMYVFGLQTPLALGHPFKILGNASAIAIAAGLIMVIARRTNPGEAVPTGRNSYQDVLFLTVLTMTVVTGILSEVFRLATYHGGAAAAYYLHLVFIFFLFFYAPFSKLAHVVYHTTALTWAHHVGRELKSLSVDSALPEAKKNVA